MIHRVLPLHRSSHQVKQPPLHLGSTTCWLYFPIYHWQGHIAQRNREEHCHRIHLCCKKCFNICDAYLLCIFKQTIMPQYHFSFQYWFQRQQSTRGGTVRCHQHLHIVVSSFLNEGNNNNNNNNNSFQ